MENTDLFNHPELLPQSVKDALSEMDFDFTPKASQALLEKLKSLGYTFDYHPDGTPYNLRKLNFD
jgi:hypothetical protein